MYNIANIEVLNMTYTHDFIKVTDLTLRDGLRKTEIFKVKVEETAQHLKFFQDSKDWTDVELLDDVHSITEV